MSAAPVDRRDDLLAAAARRGCEQSLRHLVDGYRPMVHALARTRFLPGGERDDLVQEGMIGLWHAIRDHDPVRGPFGPFARLCVDRQMWGAVTRANRRRHQPLQEAATYEPWMDVPAEGADPAVMNVVDESVRAIRAMVHAALSDLERETVIRYARGESYEEMAAAMSVHRKRIDNALQRARRKITELREADLVQA